MRRKSQELQNIATEGKCSICDAIEKGIMESTKVVADTL